MDAAVWSPMLRIVVFLALFLFTHSQEECQRGGCFPATGDLLVGRQDKLKATSTCGLKRADRYCIVSFLDKNDKCFYCDSRYEVDSVSTRTNYHNTSHLAKYVVTSSPSDRLKGWWQSENGVQDVTIQLDLEVEFVFTHLIMTFKTFRPKAMYVERSWNYGRNWSDYRYYAFNCAESFPDIPKGPQTNIDDVICEERYSKVEPSTGGEVVMKVLDPVIQSKKDEDPYSLRVQSLLKLTNLRIHFKELHTFGDDVLGDSPEVNRKYYYALYEMVVRGSCSCYGHAEQCIPVSGTLSNVNMVHGNCDCKHHTTGRNCERCKDGYNDEPWRPAYKEQLNVCRKCNCNSHTEKCHFDPAVYNSTGHTSGGVCDDCKHNTAGRQCEQCKPLYYRDPFRDITDPRVCKPCDCDPAGSFGGGECETLNQGGTDQAGRCICKANVVGRRCDRCKDGYWNLLESNSNGCQSCKCDKRGTVERDTCDQKTGNCRCKRNVKGLTCSQCLPGYWNLGTTPEGCDACGCDAGGSRNTTCDDVSGQCSCRPHLVGRKCDKVRPGYHFANLDHTRYEGENAIPSNSGTPFEVIRKIVGKDEDVNWTGDGFVKVSRGSVIDFTRARVPETGHYNIIMRYDTQDSGDWSDVRVTVTKTFGGKLGGDGCPPDSSEAEYRYPILPNNKKAVQLEPSMCFQKGSSYKIKVDFRTNDGKGSKGTLVDSIVFVPNVNKLPIFQRRDSDAYQRKQLYEKYNCKQYYFTAKAAQSAPKVCKDIQFSISSLLHNGALSCQCDPVGTMSNGSSVLTCEAAGGQCPCKPGIVGQHCNKCAPGYFGFGRNGCTACDCNPTGSTSQFCHDTTGKCKCLSQIKGRKCDSCPPFHFGFPNCKKCDCKDHSLTCDVTTGRCESCRHSTAGPNCNVCAQGYYGDASQGTENDCQRCQCPGGSSGNQFSTSCVLDGRGRGICNNCTIGYTGNQCEKCADGYFGNPLKAGGSCAKCDCGGNIDTFRDGKCDSVTGECFNCVNNAVGKHCERCKPKYFGNARNQTCRACVCNSLGTDPAKQGICDPVSGQCPCMKNVDGLECNKCAPGFYSLASGKGCLECNCHKKGSLEGSCNQLDGQCRCRVGFGGRNCGECEDYQWGNPMNNTCKACGCNPLSSLSLQCDRTNGKCKCKEQVVGDKCNSCAARTAGIMPKCKSCHVCNDQWEDIVSTLEKKIVHMLKLGGNKTFNASGLTLYNTEVKELKEMLKEIEEGFRAHRVDPAKIRTLITDMHTYRTKLEGLRTKVKDYVDVVKNTTQRDTDANVELDNLKLNLDKIQKRAKEFKTNVTKIIEGNIGGALNSTLDSLRRSKAAQVVVDGSKDTVKESKKMRKKMKKEVINGNGGLPFEAIDENNNKIIGQLSIDATDLEKKLKELNELLCGKNCGGCNNTSCSSCGKGANCNGVKKLANNALETATKAKKLLEKKQTDAKQLKADVEVAERMINTTHATTQKAKDSADIAKKIGVETKTKIIKLIKDIEDFLKADFKGHPNASKTLAEETLGLNISLTPQEVGSLAEKIRTAVQNLTDVKKILNESRTDYLDATKLKEDALKAKRFAIQVMNRTQKVLDALAETVQLQDSTDGTIKATKKVIADATDIINQIKAKLAQTEKDLNAAEKSTKKIEDARDNVKEEFKKNKDNLGKAEEKYSEAKKMVVQVTKSSDILNSKYNTTKEKLTTKQESLGDVRDRINALDKGADQALEKAASKITILVDLRTKYTLNERRARDLSDELRRLGIKAKSIRDQLKELSQCHSGCNPTLTLQICGKKLADVKTIEKQEKSALDAEISSRSS